MESIDFKEMRHIYMKYKEIFYKANVYKSLDLITSLKDIFHQERIPLICLIWNLVFTLPETDIFNLSKLINPIESKLLLSSEMMFNKLNRDMIYEIINWSKWVFDFQYFIPILSEIFYTEEYTSDMIEGTIESLKSSIKYLEISPEKLKEFWNSDDLIDKCKEYLLVLNQKTQQ